MQFDSHWLKPVLRYGLPLVPVSLSLFVLNFSDRFFLVRYCSSAELGLYALAYRFAMLVSTFYGVVSLAWGPWAFQVGERSDGTLHLRRATAFVLLAFACVSNSVALLSVPIIRLMSAPPFWAAARYIPMLAFAYWLFVAQAPLSIGTRLARRTEYLAAANGLAALLCLILSFILIPRFGVWGATWMTALSFAFLVSAVFFVSQRVFPINHDWLGIGLAVLIAMTPFGYGLLQVGSFWSDLSGRLITVTVCGGVAWLYANSWVRASKTTSKAVEHYEVTAG